VKSIILTYVTASLLLLGACASQPQNVAELEQARASVASANQIPMAERVAGAELEQARDQLQKAEHELANGDDIDKVRYHAYLAIRNAEIVRERAAERAARDKIASAEAERNRVLLTARTDEAERAKQVAMAQGRDAALARDAAAAALAEARQMEEQLKALKAENTARGVVLTLSDVLFETDREELLPGAYPAVDRLVQFLDDNPERRLLIEGHTDSTGADQYNQALSKRRADAVRAALVDRGIDTVRLASRGLGEAYPVASNNTAEGRQLNRRVEIVVSDKEGKFPAAAKRGS
tara:strand:+ start:19950 stop:20831 length:882 start_codon:yes stop_codon:yes gene_type:complete